MSSTCRQCDGRGTVAREPLEALRSRATPSAPYCNGPTSNISHHGTNKLQSKPAPTHSPSIKHHMIARIHGAWAVVGSSIGSSHHACASSTSPLGPRAYHVQLQVGHINRLRPCQHTLSTHPVDTQIMSLLRTPFTTFENTIQSFTAHRPPSTAMRAHAG